MRPYLFPRGTLILKAITPLREIGSGLVISYVFIYYKLPAHFGSKSVSITFAIPLTTEPRDLINCCGQ